ncbi:GEVED domain-containing protein [Fulvivirgaceae bacterium BMA10]|uniref:GEVED domain-containing protein n=1 Tax=Splendidivirga corallicola TaxID=3051826 RepID=A0ABT8KY57_9BACT|nr:GEVED domain-containing protein [Fulvivirgaceae bacterium BMA10]
MNHFFKFRKRYYKVISVLSILLLFSIFLLNPKKESKRLTVKDQIALYGQSSFEDIERMSKYDRPDLAVLQNFDMTRDPSINEVPNRRTLKSFEAIKQQFAQSRAAISGVNWEERGPNNVGGRTRALMFDPNDANAQKVWAGSVAGGLWFNNNITSSSSQWQNIDDFWANLAISSLAYDPTNTQVFYAGTGEGFFNADAVRGAGIWKSSNGGTSWTQLASTDNSNFHYVQKVVVLSDGTVMAATRAGVYRSTNGGTSWTSVLSGQFADIEVASNGDIYVGALSDGSVRKSTNSGTSFTTVTPTTGGGRVELAIAPSNASVVYAVASGTGTSSGNIQWFRKSTNGGSTWTTVTVPNYLNQNCTVSSQDFARGQAWYDLILAVQPSNPDIVIVGGVDLHRSTNGGSSWSAISYWTGSCRSYVHADQHAIVFSPNSSNTAIFGTDGGVFYSTNAGNSTATPSFSARNTEYNVTQFYAADQNNLANSNVLLAGSQDNGSHRFTSAGVNSTTEVTGGDGAFCHVDQDNSNYQVTSYVYNSYYRSTNGGSSFTNILFNTNDGRFINPTEYDDDANVLYCANNDDQYRRITNMTGSPSSSVNNVNFGGFRVSAIKASKHTNNRVFMATGTHRGTGGSKVFRVDNANGSSPTVTEIGTSSLPGNGYISSIDVGTSDDQIIITYSNYGLVSVWETRNGGSSWSNREGNLPDIPVRWVIYNPNNTDEVLIATELGVWSTDNVNTASPDWGVTNTGLANVRCDMLQYRDSDGQVIVATHGRGAFTAKPFTTTTTCDVPTGLVSSNVGETSFTLSWNAVSGAVSYDVDVDGTVTNTTSTTFDVTGLTASTTYSARVRAVCASATSAYSASIQVTTSTGGLSCPNTVASFPYNESFESGIGVWNQPTGDDGNWVRDSGGTPSNGTGPSTGAEGSFYMFIEASNNNSTGAIGSPDKVAIFESPCFDLSGETAANFIFDYHMNGTGMGTLNLDVTTNGSSWTTLWTRSGGQGNSWIEENIDLAAYAGQIIKLRFHGTTGSSWSSDMAIDDIEVTTGGVATCNVPTGLSSSNIAQTSFTLSWDAVSGAVSYDVDVDGTVTNTTSTSTNITGLTAATTYNAKVRAVCASATSAYSATIQVTTTPDGITCANTVSSFPYSESFESGIGVWNQPTGDDGNWVRDSGGTPSNGTGPSTGSNGSFYMFIEASNNSSTGAIGYPNKVAIFESPCFDLSGETSANFNFDYHMNGTAMGTLNLEVSTNGSTWTSLWTKTGSQGNSWIEENIDLTSYAGQTIMLRFHGTTGSSWSSDMAIDDVVVTVGGGGAAPVADFTASATTVNEGATINFTDQSTNSPTSWVWNFPGGTPSSSTSQNPSVTYNTAGTYDVTLTATNASGNDAETKTGYITVNTTTVTYCAASSNGCGTYEYISNVAIGSIDHATNCSSGGYEDNTGISTDLSGSQSLTVSIGRPDALNTVGAWIDWNQDGDFSDPDESISMTFSGSAGTGTVTVPASAAAGSTRLRVRVNYNAAAPDCGNTTYGETEDYTVNVTAQTIALSQLNENPFAIASASEVYPNPSFNGYFNVRFNKHTDRDIPIKVYDMKGSLVFKTIQRDNKNNSAAFLDLSHLPRGTYTMQVILEKDVELLKLVLD